MSRFETIPDGILFFYRYGWLPEGNGGYLRDTGGCLRETEAT